MSEKVTCWNGHPFETSMGPGVRGIQTICPKCGAGMDVAAAGYRVRVIKVAPEMLVRFLRGETQPARVIANALPDDAKIIEIRTPPGGLTTMPAISIYVRSRSYSPINPGFEHPEIPGPVFEATEELRQRSSYPSGNRPA